MLNGYSYRPAFRVKPEFEDDIFSRISGDGKTVSTMYNS